MYGHVEALEKRGASVPEEEEPALATLASEEPVLEAPVELDLVRVRVR